MNKTQKALESLIKTLESLKRANLRIETDSSSNFRLSQTINVIVHEEVIKKLEGVVEALKGDATIESVTEYHIRSLVQNAKHVTSNTAGRNIEIEVTACVVEILRNFQEKNEG